MAINRMKRSAPHFTVGLRIAGALLACATALTLSSCSAPTARSAFDDIQRSVAERGVSEIHWRRGGAEDEAVDGRIREMLGRELSADDAVRIALLDNRGLQRVYESLGVAQADLVRAGLFSNPVIAGDIRFRGGVPNAELSLVQSFLDLFFVPLRARVAEASFESEKLRVTTAVLDLTGRVRHAYYAHQAAKESVGMARQALNAARASYDLRKRLHGAGSATDLDLANEQALLEEARLELTASELEVLERRESLNRLMGLWGNETSWRTAERLPELPDTDSSVDSLERTAIERSVALAHERIELEIAARQAGFAVPLAITGQTEIGVALDKERESGWGVGPAFSIPIPLLDLGQGIAPAAEARIRARQHAYYETAVNVRSAARILARRLEAKRAEVKQYSKVLLPLRGRVVEETQKELNAMLIGPFQLLMAKRDAIDAGRRYVATLADYWNARTDLELLLNGFLPGEMTTMPDAGDRIGENGRGTL